MQPFRDSEEQGYIGIGLISYLSINFSFRDYFQNCYFCFNSVRDHHIAVTLSTYPTDNPNNRYLSTYLGYEVGLGRIYVSKMVFEPVGSKNE